MKEMLSKVFDRNKLPKTFLVNIKKIINLKKKNDNLTVLRRNRRDTYEPNGNLKYQLFKVGFK